MLNKRKKIAKERAVGMMIARVTKLKIMRMVTKQMEGAGE